YSLKARIIASTLPPWAIDTFPGTLVQPKMVFAAVIISVDVTTPHSGSPVQTAVGAAPATLMCSTPACSKILALTQSCAVGVIIAFPCLYLSLIKFLSLVDFFIAAGVSSLQSEPVSLFLCDFSWLLIIKEPL